MKSNEIRLKFLKFFEGKDHKIIPSASLIPENDPSVLFTTAGMHPLVPYLLGEKHPLGSRLVSVQKCIRTGDIDEVGDYCHHTFFEMFGNWSLGNDNGGYFKEEAIKWSYEFLTKEEYLGLDKNRIAVSVFKGDDDAPFDEEAFTIWRNLGIDKKRIAKLPKKNNWWGPAGEKGPCGPDTEIFYWAGDLNKVPESFNDDNPLWLEIWNNVFMQYNKNKDGNFEILKQSNVDTGMGLERVLAVVNNLDDNYRTELFWPIIKEIEKLSEYSYDESTGNENDDIKKSFRIIADHLKASTFILGDEKGIIPSNSGQGYVLRRLIRRAIVHGRHFKMKSFTPLIAQTVIDIYKDIYPELLTNKDFILSNLKQEEEKFEKTLEHGLKEFEKGVNPFVLFTTYGFPVEITEELAKEKGQKIDRIDFDKKLKEHQKLSQTASAGMFKGGLADAGEETKKLHTATHLLNVALRQVLGNHVIQKGSNINAERLRFDFTHPLKMTESELKEIEDIVNKKINEQLPVNFIEIPKKQAEKIALHSFNEKYGDIVKVYYVGDNPLTNPSGTFSAEFCGGPHVDNTKELGHFKIQKEEASSSGVRRIKAILV
jgi:alanyl-tRNA synthetase